MTATITIKARAVPVTVKTSEDADPLTIDPWQEKQLHAEGSTVLTITEAEPAASAEENDSPDEAVDADRGYSRGRRRAPAADSDETQIG